jgi:hypothetical protein
LNNHQQEAMQGAQKALSVDPAPQPWVNGSLADAYSLLNQPARGRDLYLANKGVEMKGDLFEHSVPGDLDLLRRWRMVEPKWLRLNI